MTNKFSYSGRVTLIHKIGDKAVSKSYHNRGEQGLFEAYARAISGQDISKFIPKYIRIFTKESLGPDNNSNVETNYGIEVTKNPIPVSVVYKDDAYNTTSNDGNTNQDYSGPFARVSGIITKSMINSDIKDGTAVLELYSSKVVSSDTKLATIEIDNLFADVSTMSSGAHYIILWDLFVQNNISTNNGGTN